MGNSRIVLGKRLRDRMQQVKERMCRSIKRPAHALFLISPDMQPFGGFHGCETQPRFV